MNVLDVIRHGRDLHPGFGDELWTPSGALLRHLSRYQQKLLGLLADAKRDAVRETDEIAMPLDDFAAGAELTPYILVHGADVVFTDPNADREALTPVGYKERLHPGRYRYGGYVQGLRLFLLGRAEDWTGVLRIDVHYFPQGAELRGQGAEFVLPGQALDVLVASAAAFVAKRAPDHTQRQQTELEAREAQELYLDQVAGRRRATVTYTREAW